MQPQGGTDAICVRLRSVERSRRARLLPRFYGPAERRNSGLTHCPGKAAALRMRCYRRSVSAIFDVHAGLGGLGRIADSDHDLDCFLRRRMFEFSKHLLCSSEAPRTLSIQLRENRNHRTPKIVSESLTERW